MNEMKKSITFVVVSVLIVVIAFVTMPKVTVPSLLTEEGELFFPNFTDPNSAISLEVIDFDTTTGNPIPFKVLFEDNKWTIPSEYNYPADGKELLAQTAASIITIKKDEFRSQSSDDYAKFGVIDPLKDDPTLLQGRGKLVTIKGENDVTLASLIIGKPVEGKSGFNYVRAQNSKDVYAAKVTLELSTDFKDWIEKDLLLADQSKIDRVLLKDYSVNEQTGSLNMRDSILLTKEGSSWTIDKMATGKELDQSKVTTLLREIDGLTIVGVRPKPEGVSATLEKISNGAMQIKQDVMMSLQSKGFFFGSNGTLYSNEGELLVSTNEGVEYTLRFGEVAASENSNDKELQRYLFISAAFDSKKFPEPEKPTDTGYLEKADSLFTEEDHANKARFAAYSKWESEVSEAKKIAKRLNNRFGKWYYLISSESFDKIALKRKDFEKEPAEAK